MTTKFNDEVLNNAVMNIINTYKRVGAYELLKSTKLFYDQVIRDLSDTLSHDEFGVEKGEYRTTEILSNEEKQYVIDYVKSLDK